jgi:hypothetical protein
LVPGLSPVPVSAPLPSCSNPATLSKEATIKSSLPFSFPPSLVTQMFQAIPLVGSSFFGGHGLDAAIVPCSFGFVPPPLIGAAEMGEKIRSSLPMLQPSKPFQRYYRKARDLREGQVKWNDGLLVDSMEGSKKSGRLCNKASVAEPNSKEDSTAPPLKSSAGTTSNEKKEASNGKKSFLRKGFLNLRLAVLAPSTSLSLPSKLAPSSTSEDKEVGVVRENGITQSQQWPVGFSPSGEAMVWEQDEEFWDRVPLDWEMDDGLEVESLAILNVITEDFYRDQLVARKKTKGKRELLNLKCFVNYGDVSAPSRRRK